MGSRPGARAFWSRCYSSMALACLLLREVGCSRELGCRNLVSGPGQGCWTAAGVRELLGAAERTGAARAREKAMGIGCSFATVAWRGSQARGLGGGLAPVGLSCWAWLLLVVGPGQVQIKIKNLNWA